MAGYICSYIIALIAVAAGGVLYDLPFLPQNSLQNADNGNSD